ncbi:MAG TPA: aminomethyltransferase family protein [Pyrinomonadaceae bacterium]|nr:aminomethyltransferase family protein [Pyrinomonadaceae bacterium]
MIQSVMQMEILELPLRDSHLRLGATMSEHNGWSVPESYGDVLLEYAEVRDGGCGVIDLSSRGRMLVSGTEAVQFLNGLITNDMKTLALNNWMSAAFPNVQGRLIASVRVARLKDEGTDKNVSPVFLIDTEAATHERVLKTIERFTLAGDFRVTEVTNQTAQFSVKGSKAADLVRATLGDGAADLLPKQSIQIAWPRSDHDGAGTDDGTNSLIVMRESDASVDGFDFVVNADQAGSLWEAMLNAGARPVGYAALEILRIEAGEPRYGVDMDETNVVTETGLDDAVSYTKGCYVGQEIIARIKYRGHVAKKLTGITFEQPVKVEVGATIQSADGKEAGRITSVTSSPRLGRTIALAYLKYDYLAAGTSVKVISGTEVFEARVTELPFVRA